MDTITIYPTCTACEMEYQATAHIQPAEPGVGIRRGYCDELDGLPATCECGQPFDLEAEQERAFELFQEGQQPEPREPWEDELWD